MPRSGSSEEPVADAHELLGIAREASPDQLERMYWRLRAHIESRAARSRDAGFIAARQAELEQLDISVARALGTAVKRPLRRLHAEGTRDRRFSMLALACGVGLAAAALTTFLWLGSDSKSDPPMSDASQPAELATVSARARPAGASLEILDNDDAQVVGRGAADGSPLAIAAGDYRLRVSRADCPDEWVQHVALEAGEAREFAPRICQGSGNLVVRSNVVDDRLQIDGLDVGSTGATPHPVSVGDHEVRIEKRGFVPWLGQLRIRADEEITLQAELERSAASSTVTPPARVQHEATASAQPPAERAPSAASSDRTGVRSRATSANALGSNGGSRSWHDSVRDRLLSQYDHNRSQSLDSPEEINAIPCAEWRSIESSYETGGLSVPMTRLYGFDGSTAPANTLGITHDMRSHAYDRMKHCGLSVARAPGANHMTRSAWLASGLREKNSSPSMWTRSTRSPPSK